MNRASERAAELAKKRKAIENKLLVATMAESNAEREKMVSENHTVVCINRLVEARELRKELADQLAELSKD